MAKGYIGLIGNVMEKRKGLKSMFLRSTIVMAALLMVALNVSISLLGAGSMSDTSGSVSMLYSLFDRSAKHSRHYPVIFSCHLDTSRKALS